MKILDADSDGWTEVESDEDGAERLGRSLAQILLAENLAVLAGLGASRCIADQNGSSSAPTMDDLWEAVAEADPEGLNAARSASGWSDDWPSDVELLLSRCQMANELGSGNPLSEFIERAERAIVEACRFTSAGMALPVHEAFLRKVARRTTRLPRAQIFTTNYDLAFETAAANTGFAVIDGFSHSYPRHFDPAYFDYDYALRDRSRSSSPVDWAPNVVHLHKLHGSVDWAAADGAVQRVDAPTRPLIIYPRSTKFEVSYQQPFLELMARFQSALRRADSGLLIVGTGLNDRHISEPILSAIRTNIRLAAAIVSPDLESGGNGVTSEILDLIKRGDRRLVAISGSFEMLVDVMPDLVPTTETERHQSRVRDEAQS